MRQATTAKRKPLPDFTQPYKTLLDFIGFVAATKPLLLRSKTDPTALTGTSPNFGEE